MALAFIGRLYRVEKRLRSKDPLPDRQAVLRTRAEQSVPILDAFETWLQALAPRVLPKCALGKAVHYVLGQRPKLT